MSNDQTTYSNKLCFLQDNYQQRLTQLTKIDENSNGDMQEVGGEKRLQLWVDVAGGLSRGNCYGTGALSFNIRPGVSHLTQECCPPENEVIEMFRQEAAAARRLPAQERLPLQGLQRQSPLPRLHAPRRGRLLQGGAGLRRDVPREGAL